MPKKTAKSDEKAEKKVEKMTDKSSVKKPEKKAEKKAEMKPKAKPVAKAKSEPVPASSEPVKVVKEKKQTAKAKAEQAAATESNKKWSELKLKHGDEKAVSYNMTSTIAVDTPIQHKIFGWGYVIKSENDRLEVLFETGTKQLISNYKR